MFEADSLVADVPAQADRTQRRNRNGALSACPASKRSPEQPPTVVGELGRPVDMLLAGSGAALDSAMTWLQPVDGHDLLAIDATEPCGPEALVEHQEREFADISPRLGGTASRGR
jgi:hypothetical protein